LSRARPKRSSPPASETRTTGTVDDGYGYAEVDLAPMRDSETPPRQLLCYGRERQASLAALFREIYLASDDSPRFAVYALEQVGFELSALHALLESEEGRDLNTKIVLRVVAGIEHRARVGAEVGKRMLAANEGGAS
jgi:hypothetical protein